MTKRTPPAKRESPTDIEDGGDLEKELDQQIGDLVPQKARGQVVKRLAAYMVSEYFAGPIAHPRHLAQYEEIQPGAADRIIKMAEDRNAHHMSMDEKIADAEIDDRNRGMRYGAGLFALLILCAFLSAIIVGNPVITGFFLGTTVIGGVGLFVRGRNKS